jgi:DNA modification methylase
MIDLRCGDCLKILPTLGPIDAVVTDPPYGMKWDTDHTRFSGGHRGHRSAVNGRRWGSSIAGDDQPFDPSLWLDFDRAILWGSNHFSAKLPTGTTLVWVKRNEHAYGSFLSDAEVAWMKGGHGVYLFKDLSMYSVAGARVHPAQKPVALMRWCIERLKLKPGATILDPYMGSGSTGVAAVQLGCNFIGIDLHRPYVTIARRRIKAVLAQSA